MAWADLPVGFREIVERVCTPAELDVFRRIADGAGLKRIARARGTTPDTVRTLRDRGEHKIRAEIRALRGYQDRNGQ